MHASGLFSKININEDGLGSRRVCTLCHMPLTNRGYGLQDVLRYMHSRPEQLPKPAQPGSPAPAQRQVSPDHARARAMLPKKAFCDSQAAAAQLQQQQLQRCHSSQPQEPTAVAHIQLGGNLRDAPTAKAAACTAADGKVTEAHPARYDLLRSASEYSLKMVHALVEAPGNTAHDW